VRRAGEISIYDQSGTLSHVARLVLEARSIRKEKLTPEFPHQGNSVGFRDLYLDLCCVY